MNAGLVVVGGLLILVVVIIVTPLLALSSGFFAFTTPADGCNPSVTVDASKIPTTVEGLSKEQLTNATAIIAAAKELGLPLAAQVLGIQCSYGEAKLKILTYGDAAGPDSVGLYQQRANGAWGTLADRMNARISSLNFFKALKQVTGWETLPPTIAIHRVQRNQDPNYYAQYRQLAESIVSKLSGATITTADMTCHPGGGTVGEISGKWVHPLPGSVMTSGYGPRATPAGTADIGNFHYGMDFSTPGGPGQVRACTDLRIVVAADSDGMFGTRVDGQTLDGKLTIGFYHMQTGSLKVKVGDTVGAGTVLGTEGATGNVTGRHCHVEFFLGAHQNPYVPDFETTNPAIIFEQKGVKY